MTIVLICVYTHINIMNNLDKIFLNLKILEKIPVSGKLYVKTDENNKYSIYLEQDNYIFLGIKRYFSGSSRELTLLALNSIINDAIVELHNNISENVKYEIFSLFEKSLICLNNLRKTYENDLILH